MDKRLEVWCDQVIGEVRFRMDHNKIRAELEDHIEDHCSALEDLNYPPELAAERTLAAMGDPVVVGKALDKEHSPWLGWLWVASIVAVLFAWMWLYYDMYPRWGHYLERVKETAAPTVYEVYGHLDENAVFPEDWGYVCTGTGSHGAIEAGDYILEIEKAVWWRIHDKWTDIYMLMTVKPQKFWYSMEIEFLGDMQATDSTGAVIANGSMENFVVTSRPDFMMNHAGTKPFGSRQIIVRVTLREDPDWVEFSYPYGDNDWVIRVEREAVE